MALLPTIPTSFVPHVASTERRNARSDFNSAFGVISYIIFIVALALSVGVFFYNRILIANDLSKQAELVTVRKGISLATAQEFVQLRDRLNASQILLSKHVAFSGFFAAVEALLPATVRFTSIHILNTTTGSVKVEGAGISKSFNALSAASESFATDGRIKDVIFSKMSINKDRSISFQFAATLDPKMVTYSPATTGQESTPAPVSASDATSTTPSL